ncbi:MAG TPA: hypothetical protein VH561_06050 [Micromonosporaceae bacterium]
MAYTVPQPPPAKRRPGVVSFAVALMWIIVAAEIVARALAFLPNEKLSAALDQFYKDHPELNNSSANIVGGAFEIVVALAIIIGLAVLAVFVRRGSQPARVVTWVIGGLGVACLGCGSLAAALAPSLLNSASSNGNTNAQASKDLLDLVRQNTPDWQYYLSNALTVVVVLALILVIILLAVPASNDFFRKEQEVWVPPAGYSGGGGFPQVPPPATPQNPMAPPPPPAAPPGPPSP